MRSLSPKFSHVVSLIVEAKDLSKMIVDELSSSLKGHEGWVDMYSNSVEDKAFQVRFDATAGSSSANVGERLRKRRF